jgi:hypothetical protein
VESEEHLEQTSSTPYVGIQVRRFIKEHQPYRRYSSNEYVLFSDGGEPKSYQKVMLHDQKN